MPVTSNLGILPNNAASILPGAKNARDSSAVNSFATLFSGLTNTSGYTDGELKKAFSSNNTPALFAKQAATMGLNESQIQRAMSLSGYGSIDPNTSKSNIENWVANADNGFTWGANGALTQVQPTSAQVQGATAQNSSGMTIAGHYVSTMQIKEFFAQSGNVNEVAQRNGITDPWEIGSINGQARKLAGITLTVEENQRSYFKEYQKYNPNGKYANDFAGFVKDQDPFTRMNMEIGQFTGPVTALADFEPGGIYGPGSAYYGQPGYGSGLGPRGIGNLGGGWAETGAAGAVGGAQPS